MTVLQKSLKRNVNVILSGSQIDQVACDHLNRSLKALAEQEDLGLKKMKKWWNSFPGRKTANFFQIIRLRF